MSQPRTTLKDPQALDVLRDARLCDLAVGSRLGPHVTPEAFAVAAGRIWVVTSCKSLKVRSIRRSPHVGLLARSGARSLSLRGRAEVLSPWSRTEAARLISLGPAILEAATRYAIGNLPTMAGYLLDLCRLPAGSLPLDRVLVAITPDAGILGDEGDIARTWGRMARAEEHAPQPWAGPPAGLTAIRPQLPADVAALLDVPSDCAVSFTSERGPIVVPGTWDPDRRTAEVPLGPAKACGLPETGHFCIMIDDSDALRPTQLRGIMLRGPGRMLRHKMNAAVEPRVRRATWWSGFATGTVKAPALEVARGGRAV